MTTSPQEDQQHTAEEKRSGDKNDRQHRHRAPVLRVLFFSCQKTTMLDDGDTNVRQSGSLQNSSYQIYWISMKIWIDAVLMNQSFTLA